jgi:2-polyprenyl-3-methyl-5-hydroxy-6-metoxy-1,4-benzoquinol methylase
MTDEERLDRNRSHWDELAELHPNTEYYDVEGFRDGGSSLDWLELEGVGDVSGQTLLHLQCHFGLDTLSWLREGAAEVVGTDFSATAIETARDLAEQVDLADRATFIESDLYALDEEFDVVFTSYGVLNWLPDVEAWADIVAHFLKPGGRFFIAELHPISHVFMDLRVDEDDTVRSDWPYFSDEPLTFDEDGSYADFEANVEHTVTHVWSHSVGEIVTALVDAGLTVNELREHPFVSFEQFPGRIRKRADGHWEIPDEDYPLTFSARAHKPA